MYAACKLYCNIYLSFFPGLVIINFQFEQAKFWVRNAQPCLFLTSREIIVFFQVEIIRYNDENYILISMETKKKKVRYCVTSSSIHTHASKSHTHNHNRNCPLHWKGIWSKTTIMSRFAPFQCHEQIVCPCLCSRTAAEAAAKTTSVTTFTASKTKLFQFISFQHWI